MKEENDIIAAMKKIDTRIDKYENSQEIEKHRFGIHVTFLPYLTCPDCKTSQLDLECQSIHANMVFDGTLTCTCGRSLKIEDGILISDSFVETLYDIDIDLDHYIEETGEGIIANIRKGINWFNKTIETSVFDNAMVMEIGSGSGFFIRSAYSHIEKTQYYIAVDHDITRHKFLKAHLESAGISLPIQFICSDYRKLPLRDACIDILVDFTGTSNIGFDTPNFMLDTIDTHLKEKCELMASYIIFDKFSANHFLPHENRHIFNKDAIYANLEKNAFTIDHFYKGDYHTYGGPYEDYFTREDKVYKMWLHANKKP